MKSFFNKLKLFIVTNKKIGILFISSLFVILIGFVFLVIGFLPEVLENEYVIVKSSSYSSQVGNLQDGQIKVTKDVLYNRDGVYKLVFKNYSKGDNLLKENSNLEIYDILGDGYSVLDNVVVNSKKCHLDSDSCGDISVSNKDGAVVIFIPYDKINDKNKIEVYIKLEKRKINYKYDTSTESYYNIIPSESNDYYEKKTFQSYIVEGNGVIILNKK